MRHSPERFARSPVPQIAKEDIESLVNAKVGEKRTLDYKQHWPDNSSEGKREFLYDVSSFANALGGDLVFGIEDEREAGGKATGLPASDHAFPNRTLIINSLSV